MSDTRYQHDCNNCIFLGHYKEYDLYYCPSDRGAIYSTVIARYGNEGHEYASGINSMTMPGLNEAKARAIHELGVNFKEYNPLNITDLAVYLKTHNPKEFKILNKQDKSILYFRTSGDSGIRERIYLAAYIAEHPLFDISYHGINCTYYPYNINSPSWEVLKEDTKITIKVKTDAVESQKVLDELNWIFIDKKI
jgi:hypothetical protein